MGTQRYKTFATHRAQIATNEMADGAPGRLPVRTAPVGDDPNPVPC
jgi:hypothetical protein